MWVRMWDTVGSIWRSRRRDVKCEGEIEGFSARRRSGLSKIRRVFRVVVERKEEMAVVIVVWRSESERDGSV
jgi:hypothetical protein